MDSLWNLESKHKFINYVPQDQIDPTKYDLHDGRSGGRKIAIAL